MKKILTFLLTVFMFFSLVGCNSKNEEPTIEEPEIKQQEVVVEEVNKNNNEPIVEETIVDNNNDYEDQVVDYTKLDYWVITLDQNGNVIDRYAAPYGSTVYDPEGKAVMVKGNVRFYVTVQGPKSKAFNPRKITEDEFNNYFKEGNGVLVTNQDGTATIGDGSNALILSDDVKNLVIPESVGGQKITEIAWGCFKNNNNLESVTIPGGINKIGASAFAGCDSLKFVTIEDGVTAIGGNAFGMCHNLKSLTIPSSVTSFGGGFADMEITVNYEGTKEDFFKITSVYWFELCNLITVKCTDGTVYYNSSGDVTEKVECEKKLSDMIGAEVKIKQKESYLTVTSMKYSSGKSITVPYSLDGGNYYISTIEYMSFPSEIEEIYFQAGLGKLGDNGKNIVYNIDHKVDIYLPYISYLGSWAFEGCSDIVLYYPGTQSDFMGVLTSSGYTDGEIKNYLGAYKVTAICSDGTIYSPAQS